MSNIIGYSQYIDPYSYDPYTRCECVACGLSRYLDDLDAEGRCDKCAEKVAAEQAWQDLLETLDDEKLWFGESAAEGIDRKYGGAR